MCLNPIWNNQYFLQSTFLLNTVQQHAKEIDKKYFPKSTLIRNIQAFKKYGTTQMILFVQNVINMSFSVMVEIVKSCFTFIFNFRIFCVKNIIFCKTFVNLGSQKDEQILYLATK